MKRVAKRRRAYITKQLEALGWNATEAQDRAVVLGYVYVGNMQMARLAPGLTTSADRLRQARLIYDTLVVPHHSDDNKE